MTFSNWIDIFAAEKGLELDQMIEAQGPSGANFIPLSILIDAMKHAPEGEQEQIRTAAVRLDFANAPILPFFAHLARAIAI